MLEQAGLEVLAVYDDLTIEAPGRPVSGLCLSRKNLNNHRNCNRKGSQNRSLSFRCNYLELRRRSTNGQNDSLYYQRRRFDGGGGGYHRNCNDCTGAASYQRRGNGCTGPDAQRGLPHGRNAEKRECGSYTYIYWRPLWAAWWPLETAMAMSGAMWSIRKWNCP